MDLTDRFELRSPESQNIVDIFKGQWSSELPALDGRSLESGSIKLFEDPRVQWAGGELGGFADRSILELGPLEAGHTFMLHQAGAGEILAVEANRLAFLRCLCVKELYGLTRAHFLLGDFVPFLKNVGRKFDILFASGVLYHLMDPVTALLLMSQLSDKLFIWTHYYDADLVRQSRSILRKFGKPQWVEHADTKYEVVPYSYKDALAWTGFSGGMQVSSKWLTRQSILDGLRVAGYAKISVNFEQPNHPHGPAFAVCAQR